MAKQTIQGKQIGKNVILIIGGEKLSKAFDSKEERTGVLDLVAEYNKKNNKSLEKKIVSAMEKIKKSKDVAAKEKLEKPKVAEKVTKKDKIEAAKALLIAEGWDISKQGEAKKSNNPYKGEY